MIKLHKFSLKKICYLFIATAFSIAITWRTEARDISAGEIYSTLTSDTTPLVKKDTIPTRPQKNVLGRDTTSKRNSTDTTFTDTIPAPRVDTFNLKLSKDTLDAPVNYEAADSGVLLVKEKKFLLYGKTKTTYQDITLTAPKVELDQQTSVLTAYNAKDSLGDVIARAQFQQKDQSFQSDTIRYNFKTKRGLTTNTYTKQNELFVNAEKLKKVNDSISFGRRITMTTCDYDDPHFGFVANRGEFITNKVAVTGPVHPEFEGVPIPIYLPFGIFPLKKGRHSGLIAPSFVVTEQFGLGLEGLGYYHVLNDYLDTRVLTNFYSFGGWSLNVIPSYRKRYHYSGQLNLSVQHTKIAFKGDPDYSVTNTFNISWSHSMDAKARRGTTFSASVNAGSTRYNQYVVNNPFRNFNNQLTSSVAYSKTWQGKPYSLTLSANHNQNNNLHLINIVLPDAGFTVTTIYPFARKADKVLGAQRWYEKIGVGYTGIARNQFSFYDTAQNSFSHILDTLQLGARHSFPLSMSLPPLGPLIVAPFISYEETWLTNRISRKWNASAQKVDTIYNKKGLFIDRQMSFGIGFNTSIYGNYIFKSGTRIRHVVRPNININYRPNLSKKYYDVIQTTPNGLVQALPQVIGGNNLFSGYGYGRFGGLSFGVDNNLEMKRSESKDSTKKVIRLIDGFGFNSAYNFLDDSLRLKPFNLYLRTTLFEKLSFTFQGVLDPYEQDSLGNQKYVWQGDKFSLGRLNSGSIAMSTSFQSKPRDPKKNSTPTATRKITDPSLLGDEQRMQEYINRNPGEFVDFNIPWSINLSYSLNFIQVRRSDLKGFRTQVTSSLSFNNTFSLTPKWMFNTSGFYDFNTWKLTVFTMSVSRDMHCWQMSVSVTPIGPSKYFSININPKSSILQDLKVNRTRYFTDY